MCEEVGSMLLVGEHTGSHWAGTRGLAAMLWHRTRCHESDGGLPLQKAPSHHTMCTAPGQGTCSIQEVVSAQSHWLKRLALHTRQAMLSDSCDAIRFIRCALLQGRYPAVYQKNLFQHKAAGEADNAHKTSNAFIRRALLQGR